MVGFCLPEQMTVEGYYDSLEYHLGEKPQYFLLSSLEQHEFDALEGVSIFIAIQMEMYRSVGIVAAMWEMSPQMIQKHCFAAAFDLHSLIRDQYLSGYGTRKLCKLHKMGHAKVRRILRENEVHIGDRKSLPSVTKEDVVEAYASLGSISQVAKTFGIHRSTVSARLKVDDKVK